MRTRGIWMLVVALFAGLVAAALALQWMRGQGGGRDRIAVASVDIGLGVRLTPQMVRLAEWPRGSVPAGAFAAAEPLDGRVVTVAVQRGEPLTEARLAPVGARAGLSAVVPPGKRAMTVRVNDVVGVAGFALPGTTVDVLVNTQHEGGRRGDSDRAISKIVLERILVLAAAQEADRDASRPKVVSAVTLEVTPNQAETLDLARSVGTLSLVLRNPADPQESATGGATKVALLNGSAVAPAPAQPPRVRALARSPRRPASPEGVPALRTTASELPAADLAPALVVEPLPRPVEPTVAAPANLPLAAARWVETVPADPVPAERPVVDPTPVPPPSAAPSRVCVEIVAGASRRHECF